MIAAHCGSEVHSEAHIRNFKFCEAAVITDTGKEAVWKAPRIICQ